MRFLRSVAVAATLAVAAIVGGLSDSAEAFPPYDLTVYNRSSRDMMEFYARNSYMRDDGWGNDLFGEDYLQPGYHWKRNLFDGTGNCVFDLKAVMKGGSVVRRNNVNVCTASSWTIYD